MQPAYPAEMVKDSPRQLRRREKLKQLVGTDPGAQAELARVIGTPKSHLSAILAGRRGIGDQLAAKLERHFEKPIGWFDQEQSTAWPFSSELLVKVQSLQAHDLQRLEMAMRVHLDMDLPDEVINRTLERAAGPAEGNAPASHGATKRSA